MDDQTERLHRSAMRAWAISRREFNIEKGIAEMDEEIDQEIGQGVDENENVYESLQPINKQLTGRFNDEDLKIRLPSEIMEMISTHENKKALEDAVKKEMMRWFWMGYYENNGTE